MILKGKLTQLVSFPLYLEMRCQMTENMIGKITVNYLNKGYNCAEATLKSFRNAYSSLRHIEPSLFSGFGGGFAKRGKVCGGIVAATAIISFFRVDERDPRQKGNLYEVLNEFYDKIEDKYGSLDCQAIKAPFEGGCPKDEVCKPLLMDIALMADDIISRD